MCKLCDDTGEGDNSEIKNMSENQIKNHLQSMDWTIKKADMDVYTHNIHLYPARMVPIVVNRLILHLSNPGDVVFDPFCGSGTVMLEAMLSGRRGIATEINPLAVKIANVKTTLVDLKEINTAYSVIISHISHPSNFKNYESMIKTQFKGKIKWLDHWFKPQVQKKLYILGEAIKKIKHNEIRNFFEIIYSATVRNVSNNRNSSYKNYKMDQKSIIKFNPDVFKSFQEYFQNGIRGVSELVNTLCLKSKYFKPNINCQNFLDFQNNNSSYDLIITSPPYGDSSTTVGYGQFSKYSLAWLGMDIGIGSFVDREGLGGKQKETLEIFSPTFYSIKEKVRLNEEKLKNKRNETLHYFFSDYQRSLVKMTGYLRSKKYICLVIGNRTMREVQIPMDIITQEILQKLGFSDWVTLYRDIPNKRHPINQKLYVDPKWAEARNFELKPVKINNIIKESILIMKRK